MIYLDNAATTWPKPESVSKAMKDCLQNYGANPGRGGINFPGWRPKPWKKHVGFWHSYFMFKIPKI